MDNDFTLLAHIKKLVKKTRISLNTLMYYLALMSFFDNTKNFGLVALIAALINVVAIIVLLFVEIDGQKIEPGNDIIGFLGMILPAIVMLIYGLSVFRQAAIISFIFPEGPSSKFGVLTGLVFAAGVSSILSLNPMGIVVGIILLIIGWIITNGNKTVVDTIIWVLMIIIFLLAAIAYVLAVLCVDSLSLDFFGDFVIGGIAGWIVAVCKAIMYILAFVYLFDKDVKSKFV